MQVGRTQLGRPDDYQAAGPRLDRGRGSLYSDRSLAGRSRAIGFVAIVLALTVFPTCGRGACSGQTGGRYSTGGVRQGHEPEVMQAPVRALPGPRGRLDLLELQRTAGNRATRALLQRFWVKERGQYRWEDDVSTVSRYTRTDENYWSYYRPWPRPVYVPLEEAVLISEDSLVGVGSVRRQVFVNRLRADLETVNSYQLGTRLLGKLATARHRTRLEPMEHQPSSGPITSQTSTINPQQYDPTDPAKGAPATINLKTETVDLLTLPMTKLPLELLGVDHQPLPEDWNLTPSHVALFHELVHAYHYVKGTRARGQLSAAQARHPGDINVSLSEYQVTGIDTKDGVAATAFSSEQFTENKYRTEAKLPPRETYIPRGYQAPQPEAERLGMS
jgi:hypothetical protein